MFSSLYLTTGHKLGECSALSCRNRSFANGFSLQLQLLLLLDGTVSDGVISCVIGPTWVQSAHTCMKISVIGVIVHWVIDCVQIIVNIHA